MLNMQNVEVPQEHGEKEGERLDLHKRTTSDKDRELVAKLIVKNTENGFLEIENKP